MQSLLKLTGGTNLFLRIRRMSPASKSRYEQVWTFLHMPSRIRTV